MAKLDLVVLTQDYITEIVTHQTQPTLERLAVCDVERGAYSVITVGWDGPKRIVGVTLLVTIHDGQLTIHYDGTPGFADYLVSQGAPESRITFAFHPPTPTTV